MFNLFRSRDKAVRIMLGIVLGAVALSMLVYLVPNAGLNSGSSGDDGVLVEIGGQKVYAQEIQQNFQRAVSNLQVPPELLSGYFKEYVQAELSHKAAAYEAEQMGLTVSDDEVLAVLALQDPQFFQNGALVSKEQYVQYLQAQGLTPEDRIAVARQDKLVDKLRSAVIQSVVVTPKEVQEEFQKRYEKAKIEYVAFDPKKFEDQVKPDSAMLRKIYDANRASYTDPEKTKFQVVYLDQDKVEANLVVTDAQLRSAYAGALDNFRIPEKIRVRHILIKTDGKSDAEKKDLKAKAEDVLKQLRAGANFADMAKKYSQDAATAEKGGDLDFIVKGQIADPAFDSAAFALKNNEISNVLSTTFGYEIVQVTDRQPARVRPFEEVKDGIATDLKKELVSEKMQMLGDQIQSALTKSPGSADAVAKQFGAQLVTVPEAVQNDPIPELGVSPEIYGALGALKANEVSSPLALPANRLAVVVLNARIPAHPAEFSEVEDRIRQTYIQDQAQKMAGDKAAEFAMQVKGGEDIDKAAKAMNVKAVTTDSFGRSETLPDLGSAVYVEDAFTKPAGTVAGPSAIQGKQVVYKVLSRTEPDPAALAGERTAIERELRNRKADQQEALMEDSILTKLMSQGKIKEHNGTLQRALAAYTSK
jgi:peptidyl-prolyl cis-trans isomerase D